MATQKSFTKKQIDDAIDSQMADNTSQAITASNVRSITKDYMTGSMAAPMLIYSGLWRQAVTNSGFGSSPDIPSSVRDFYYNPDFFQLQNTTNPASASNIFQANTTSLSGLNDTYVVTGSNGLSAVITVSNGSLTDMTIITHLGGFIVGDVITMLLNGNQIGLSLTYNGAVRVTGENSTARFVLTENSDNTYSDHVEDNSILSATPQFVEGFIRTGNNSESYEYFMGINFTSTNTLRCENGYLSGTTDRTSHPTHVQIYRIPGK